MHFHVKKKKKAQFQNYTMHVPRIQTTDVICFFKAQKTPT